MREEYQGSRQQSSI